MACAALPMAVMAQSTNNDVVKLDIRFRHNDARSGEVLVKFKDQKTVTILTHYGIAI